MGQQRGTPAHSAAVAAKEMQGHVAELGLDAAKFQQCLDSAKYASLVKGDVAEGQKYGVRGTPTFFFGTAELKDSKLHAVSTRRLRYQEVKNEA